MLYKLNTGHSEIELMPFEDFGSLQKKEKDLENLLAENLGKLYVADSQLMTIFQERARQPEPDLCALDKDGNLVIFELKRSWVNEETTLQIMRYAQDWGQKTYFDLNGNFKKYCQNEDAPDIDLREAHKEAFGLETPLDMGSFNTKQKLIIVGSSSDATLINYVDYWCAQGIDIDFIPYRIYEIGGEYYFEFFSKPYDTHINPKYKKGIIFDTNLTYDENSIWDMLNNHKVSAYGSIKEAVNSFNKGDYVLYYHKGYGIIAAGKVNSSDSKEGPDEELYKTVDFIVTPPDNKLDWKYAISYAELKELLNKGFFMARTLKVPYLTIEESEKIIQMLKDKQNL